MPKETFSEKQERLRAGNFMVGDGVAQDYKIEFGFYHRLNIEPETALALLGARVMEELRMVPKIIKIVCSNSKIQEGVQYKEGQWSLWTRKLDSGRE